MVTFVKGDEFKALTAAQRHEIATALSAEAQWRACHARRRRQSLPARP